MKTTPPVSVSRLGSAFAGVILVTLLSAPWQAATAAPVTSKQAAAVVTGWLSVDRTPLGETLGESVQRVETFNDQAGNAVYYVVYLDPSGFVIVGRRMIWWSRLWALPARASLIPRRTIPWAPW